MSGCKVPLESLRTAVHPLKAVLPKGNQARKEKMIHVNIPKEELQCARRNAHAPKYEDGNRQFWRYVHHKNDCRAWLEVVRAYQTHRRYRELPGNTF